LVVDAVEVEAEGTGFAETDLEAVADVEVCFVAVGLDEILFCTPPFEEGIPEIVFPGMFDCEVLLAMMVDFMKKFSRFL